MQSITIDRRFCCPPNSGNGGYVFWLLAAHINGGAETTLRVPPPLEHRLDITAGTDGAVELREAETVIATGDPHCSTSHTSRQPRSLKQRKPPVGHLTTKATTASRRVSSVARRVHKVTACGFSQARSTRRRTPAPLPPRGYRARI